MTDTTQCSEPRPRADSIEELSGSALVFLEPSAVDIPVIVPEADLADRALEVVEVIEPLVLARYEDCPADPTVKMLPDFSLADDLPTVPRAERESIGRAGDELERSPVSFKLPELATAPPPPLTTTLLPPPLPALPPLPAPPESARAQAPRTYKRATSLPPIAPLPAKKPDSAPPTHARPVPGAAQSSRERDTERPARPRSPVTRAPGSTRARSERGVHLPSLPLELPRPAAVLEWSHRGPERAPADSEYTDDSERTSVIPVSGAVQFRARRGWKLKNGLYLAAGAVVGLVVLVTTLWALEPARPAAKAAATDALLVTVAGPGGGAVDGPEVFIDGVRRCESSPCLVSGLTRGLHFVTVAAPQHSTTSPRVVRVAHSEPALLHVELAREPAVAVTAAKSEPLPAALPTTSELPAIAPAPAPKAPAKRPLPVDVGTGFLNLSSVPSVGVLLDGQPLGLTPKLNVRVKPGPHVIVFVHPEEGRRTRAVMVEAGAHQSVAVQF